MIDNYFKRAKISFSISSAIVILTYSLWSFIKKKYGITIFYPGIAFGFVGYAYCICSLLKYIEEREYCKKLSSMIFVSKIILIATINNLLDEIFFDPTKLGINEYLAFVILIIITYFNGRNGTRRKKRIL